MSKIVNSSDEKKLFREIFWYSFHLEASYNYERQQALGYAIGMWPAIKRYYKTKEEQAVALERHMAIFNTTPHVTPMITGVATAMEKQAAQDPNFDVESINSIKVGLMGPFAGIGDSIFWGTLRIIATGIALPLAQQGNVLGPVLFLLLFNVPHFFIRYYGGVVGYNFGTNILTRASDSGIMEKISTAANIVGLIVIGAMTAGMVNLNTVLSFEMGESVFELQTYIDQIFPKLLPFLYTLLMFKMLKSGRSSTFVLLFSIMVAILGVLIKVF